MPFCSLFMNVVNVKGNMMKNWKTFLIASIYLFIGVPSLFAFGQNGHRIVGEIAQRHLNHQTEQEITKILGKMSLAQVATWPDFMRSTKSWSFADTWHYVNAEKGQTLLQGVTVAQNKCRRRNQKRGCLLSNVIDAVTFFTSVLEGDREKKAAFLKLVSNNKAPLLNGSLEATALAFLVHTVGDLHQPLHAGRGSDSGGNKIKVKWFGSFTNIHSVWDRGLIESEHLSFTEYATFLDQASEENIKKWQRSGPMSWAEESKKIAGEIADKMTKPESDTKSPRSIYDSGSGLPGLGSSYAHDWVPVLNERMLQGGIRLAGLLNLIFVKN